MNYLKAKKLGLPVEERSFRVTGNENDLANSNRSFEKATRHKGLSVGGQLLSSHRLSEPGVARTSQADETQPYVNVNLKGPQASMPDYLRVSVEHQDRENINYPDRIYVVSKHKSWRTVDS